MGSGSLYELQVSLQQTHGSRLSLKDSTRSPSATLGSPLVASPRQSGIWVIDNPSSRASKMSTSFISTPKIYPPRRKPTMRVVFVICSDAFR
jgi:hypothetical protein